MEEALMDALLAASETLAEGLREGLRAEGQSARLAIRIEGNRAVIGSSDPALTLSEMGSSACAPTCILSRSARAAIPSVIAALCGNLTEKL